MLGTKRLFCVAGSPTSLCRRIFSTYKSGSPSRSGKEKKAEDTEWTHQQKRIISAVEEGKSVFISGSAGTGKTFLLKHILKFLRKRYKRSAVFATGSTGVAACALNGQTTHSFAGAGCPGPMGQSESLLSRILSSRTARKRWLKVEALVLDEVSMVDGELFDLLERVARLVRGVHSPWGGIQLIASGDFFQLPPVIPAGANPGGIDMKEFAFEASCWESSFSLQVELDTVFRQSDPKLVELLSMIRRGERDPRAMELLRLRCCCGGLSSEPKLPAVELYPRNADVARVNTARMRSLNKQEFTYRAVDTGREPWIRELEKGIAPGEISLCEGARVMLIKNLRSSRKLVNGAIGTVVGFDWSSDEAVAVPRVVFDNGLTVMIMPENWVVEVGGEVVAKRVQIPLILAWSVSIHKCQGMSIDRLQTDLSKAFGFGMVYVALSRVTSLEGLRLTGFDPSKIKAHQKVVEFYRNLARKQRDEDSAKFHFSLSDFLSSRQIK